MSKSRSSNGWLWVGLGLTLGVALGWLASRPHCLPDLYGTQRTLARLHGEVTGGFLAGMVAARYEQLLARRPRFNHPALRMHLEGNILPGLAIYQVLGEELGDRAAMRRIMQFGFPAQGWETEWVEDNEQRIGFNLTRCFYLDVLTSQGAPELTSTFCALDDYDARQMPPGIIFERSGTLARGQTHCDFLYCTPAGRHLNIT